MKMLASDSALDLAARLRRREVSSVELTQGSLATIRRDNPDLGAFVGVAEARALRQARRADALIARGVQAPFLGVPTGIKDFEHLRGHVTGYGSRAFRWLYAPVDGFSARACREAGFVLLGKLATSELAILPFIESPPSRNPHARDHYAGGSSGGSAAAVAANMIPIAAGSDGGGSIRIPASFCGLVGLKTGRGTLQGMSPALDPAGIAVSGPLARTVRDAAALTDVLAGTHDRFLSACGEPVPTLRVRVLASSHLVDVDPEIAAATHAVAQQLASEGHHLEDAPPLAGELEDFLPIMAHMAGRLPLVLGMRRLMQPSTLWLHGRGQGVSHGDAVAAGAALARRVFAWFGDADVVVTPTAGVLPPRVGSFANLDGEATFRAAAPLGAFTAAFNASGQPAISIPAARSRSGLPIGVQLVGRMGGERLLLALAASLLGER
ncbi:MAG: Amidase [Deltaproteobacteria bacterium]|nr:Amidase [Deltaproteobacteria bacterium]